MVHPTERKLFVNLSASQVRRRLKGHGYGVRRVESNGRNQSVIFHTATGQHLRELEGLLEDVLCATSPSELDEPLENLKNLGPSSARWLHHVGLYTRADLERVGPVVAYQLVRQRESKASLNLLWALAAALQDRDWRELTEEEKSRLRQEVS